MEIKKYLSTERQMKEWDNFKSKKNRINNITFIITINHLDLIIFEHVIQTLIDRHESFRTTFLLENSGVKQMIRINDPRKVQYNYFDFSNTPDFHNKLIELYERFTNFSFDLENGPLFKIVLIKTNQGQHILGFIIDHIISDTYSSEILKAEFSSLYDSLLNKKQINLKPLTYHMGNFALFEDNINKSEVGSNNLIYWEKELKTNLKFLKSTNKFPTIDRHLLGGNYTTFIDLNKLKKIEKLYSNKSMFLMTILLFWLSLISGNKTIILGIPFSVRETDYLKGVVGYLIQGIYLKVDFSNILTFKVLITEVINKYSQALAHRHYSRRNLSFRVDDYCAAMLNNGTIFKNESEYNLDLDNHFNSKSAPYYPIDCDINSYTNGWLISLHYNRLLFNNPIETFEKFNKILNHIMAFPDEKLKKLYTKFNE